MNWVQRLLLATLVALVTASPAHAAFRGSNGKIVFERQGSIVVQDLDGTQHVIATGSSPRWSPDGTRIAYYTTVSVGCKGVTGSGEVIRVINADGTGQRNITATGCNSTAEDPAWSPDGTRLVYVGPNITFPAATDIYTVSAAGGGSTRLTNTALIDEHPSWSSLNKIAWSSNFGGPDFREYRIWTMNADGTAQRRLSTGDFGSHGFTYDEHWPDWSPDGLKILFSSDRDQDFNPGLINQDEIETEIYTMNADGTGITRLTFNHPCDGLTHCGGIEDFNPGFSPDGRRILFESSRGDDGGNVDRTRLWRMNADGSSPLPFGAGQHGDWQPSTAATTPIASLANFRVAHMDVAGDEQGTGRIFLDDPAPAGGTRVSVSSSNPDFTVPATVTVPAGATSTTFTIGTPTAPPGPTPFAEITVSQGTHSFTDVVLKHRLPTEAVPHVDRCTTSDLFCGFATDPELFGRVSMALQMDSIAPSTGADITLTSSDPVHLKLPATYHMPARQDFVRIPVEEAAVTVRTPVTVTATYNGVSRRFDFAVLPPPIVIGDKPLLIRRVVGGDSITATVNIPEPAPAGGQVVTVSTLDQAFIHVPTSVTVPAGRTQTTFTITTVRVTDIQRVFVGVSISGVSLASGDAGFYIDPPAGTTPPPGPTTALSLDFANPTAVGGTSVTCTLTLTGPAPSGGYTLPLSSSNTTLMRVPASVTVPAGATKASFTATTSAVGVDTTVSVVGAVGANVDILGHITLTPPQTTPPPAPTALSLNPSSVTGGATSQGTITIASAAPAGGASYSLASANAAIASVPAAVVVPAGATTGTFTATTSTVTGQQIVTITATGGGSSQSATLAVNPAGGPPPPPPPGADTVRVTRAQYDSAKRELRVEATSSSSSATLTAFVDSTGARIGQLSGGKARFTNVANPGTVRVTSSLGGSATLAVSGATATVHPATGTAVAAPSAGSQSSPAAAAAPATLLHATSEITLPHADPNDHAAPRIGALRALPRSIRVGSRRGTLVSFTLSEAARVTLSFRRLHGSRFARVAGGVVRTLPNGRVRVRFTGLLANGAKLRAGVYRVVVDAVDASGNPAAPKRLLVYLHPALS